jgi:hypothetical protein
VAAYIGEHTRAGVSAARRALYGPADEEPTFQGPGDDVGEHHHLVTYVGRFFWNEPDRTVRKRVVNGKEQYCPPAPVPCEIEFELMIGPEAFNAVDGRKFLCNSLARQLYKDETFIWPPRQYRPPLAVPTPRPPSA